MVMQSFRPRLRAQAATLFCTTKHDLQNLDRYK